MRKQIIDTSLKLIYYLDAAYMILLVNEIEIPTIYKNENSDLNPIFELYRYILSHIIIFIKRIIYQYFLIDFNPGSFSFFWEL